MDGGIGIIFLAMVAVFLVARLYKVLGRRTGHERRQDPFAGAANDDQRRDTVTPIPDRTRPARADDAVAAPAGARPAGTAAGPLQAGVSRIRSADPDFDPATFIAGAHKAFEWIVGAFAAGDAASLRPLLNDEVFDNFSSAIKSRQQAGETLQTTLVGITSAELIEARSPGSQRGRNSEDRIRSDQRHPRCRGQGRRGRSVGRRCGDGHLDLRAQHPLARPQLDADRHAQPELRMLGRPRRVRRAGVGRVVIRLFHCCAVVVLWFAAGGSDSKTLLTPAAAETIEAKLQRIAFRDLPGWHGDSASQALPALLSSCKILKAKPATAAVGPGGMAGAAGDWRAPCRALAATSSDEALRQAIETWFVPFAVADADGAEGLFTGYYEPELHGSRKQTRKLHRAALSATAGSGRGQGLSHPQGD